jgi:hypothetical protein
LEESDSGEVRLSKIIRLLKTSRYSIHDLSRIRGRFNMPIELGIEIGLRNSGVAAWEQKRCLVLDSQPYRYQRIASDLAGCDFQFHQGRTGETITHVRNWIRTATGDARLPSGAFLRDRYRAFRREAALIPSPVGLSLDEVTFLDYATLVEEWLRQDLGQIS